MAIKTNDQPIVGANGDVYSADVGTPIPDDFDDPGPAWTLLGMISEDGATWTPPAEETQDIKIWQSFYPARVVTTGLTSSVSFALDGWDRVTIPFALGGGMFTDQAGPPPLVIYHPPGPGESQVKALFLKVLDGDVKLGVYFRKGRVIGRDDTTFKPDEAALLQVEFGLLAEAGQDPYNLVFEKGSFPDGLAATGATAGTPGTFTPSGASVPADLTALQGASPAIVAYNSDGTTPSGATAWSTNQVVNLGTGSAHWSGTAWASGAALLAARQAAESGSGGGK